MYDDASGYKKADYTGAAFIEVRANYDQKHPLLKLSAGAGKVHDEISEVYNAHRTFSPDPQKIYRHKIVFGDGKALLYINDVLLITATYKGTVNWSHMFVGDTNYKGSGSFYQGMHGYIFSNIVLKESD